MLRFLAGGGYRQVKRVFGFIPFLLVVSVGLKLNLGFVFFFFCVSRRNDNNREFLLRRG